MKMQNVWKCYQESVFDKEYKLMQHSEKKPAMREQKTPYVATRTYKSHMEISNTEREKYLLDLEKEMLKNT